MNKKFSKCIAITAVLLMVSAGLELQPAAALVSQNVTSWYWISDTNVSAITTGDVNGDGQNEIVTVGWYNDGTIWNAHVVVWNASNFAVEKSFGWNWNDTQVTSIAIGDVNGDGKAEIVTGGSQFDGIRWNAQVVVLDGTTLTPLAVKTWYWTSDTQIASIALANITGVTGLDVVTGGSYFDGIRWNAQLVVLNGPTLTPTKVLPWYWTSNTYISSIAVANITGGPAQSIIVGGSYSDGVRSNAQLIVLNAATLAWVNGFFWYWTGDTYLNSLAVANVTGGSSLSIVTGGSYFDGTRDNAQVVVFNGTTLIWQNGQSWYWTSNTQVNSLAIGNYSGGPNLDIITAGSYNDGFRSNAQVVDWNGGTMSVQTMTNWFVTSNTNANSVALGNFGLGNRIVVGGSYYDLFRSNAQLSLWG
jgi:hypothetical protein